MPNPTLVAPLMMMLLAGPAAAPIVAPAPVSAAPAPDWNRASGLLAQHITIHVPRMGVTRATIVTRSVPVPPPPPAPMYREKKADNCVKMKKVKAFAISSNDTIDLLLDDGNLWRARFGADCRALGFYSGFYVKPNPDGKICVKRDVLRSRMGRGCTVGQFTRLVPVK
jgi:hypothetical protein